MFITLSALFTDHAVLQQGIPVPVWGWAAPRTLVTADVGGVSATTRSGYDGRFRLDLPPMSAGGPYELKVFCAEEVVTVRDVFVGEVWLASGQSNMQWTLDACDCSEPVMDLPAVRMISVDRTAMIGQRSNFDGCWKAATSKDAPTFSAVAYYFARRVQRELGVTVGIINSSWSGTLAEAWTSRETLAMNPDYAPWMHQYHTRINTQEYWEVLDSPPAKSYPEDPGNKGLDMGWGSLEFDDSTWQEMTLPSTWQAAGHEFSGVFWFRKTVEVPSEWAGQDLQLSLGAVDKQDITYVNGERVGSTGSGLENKYWNVNRIYVIPGRLVRPGRNMIAVRAYSFVYSGGLIGPARHMALSLATDAGRSISLSGKWRFQVEHDLGLVFIPGALAGEGCANSPHILFDNMIYPLLPYGIRGAIWYQGESNTEANDKYRRLLVELIRCWRYAWGQGDFPFLQVQLANWMAAAPFQFHSDWALLREAQLLATQEPGVGMAVAIDIGDADNIHPKNKREVGHRLAQWALSETYGLAVAASGPLYSRMAVEEGRIRIYFAHTEGGLVGKGGELKTFVIAGNDRHFVEASAVIDGNTVVVSSAMVTQPVAVRYAWADNPEGCNLHNAEGLPASPFRTDTWWSSGSWPLRLAVVRSER